MLSYQIREYYEFALKELEKFEKHMEVLFEYEAKYNEISHKTLTLILADAQQSSSSQSSGHPIYHYSVSDGKLVDVFNKYNISLSSDFDLLTTFSEFATYKAEINKYKFENDIYTSEVDNLLKQINILFQSYQDYIRSQNDRAEAVKFMQNLIAFRNYFDATKNFYHQTINMLNSITDVEPGDDCSVMEIQLLAVKFTFEEFTSYLNCIQKIYSELNRAIYLNEDRKASPLEIIKIESGSLLSKFLGDNNILEALGLLLTKTINLCFQKFTKSGQLQTLSDVRKQLFDDLDLRDRLLSLGLDVSSTDENILVAYERILHETLRLASSTSKFKINGEIIKCNDFNDLNYLEARKIKLIEEKPN